MRMRKHKSRNNEYDPAFKGGLLYYYKIFKVLSKDLRDKGKTNR